MANAVYVCRNKGNADKAFRTSGRVRTSLEKQASDLEAKRSQPKHRTVQLTADLSEFASGSPVPWATAQVVQLSSSGAYQTTSVHDNSTLPTVTIYSKSSTAYSTGDYLEVEWDQGNWWHIDRAAPGGTGYGALSADLATSDATASITLDATSPIDSGQSITATNWVGMDGSTGAKCIVTKTGNEYVLIQLACPEETP